MSRQPASRHSAHAHLVRPRWVWGGTFLLCAGAAVVGIGVIRTSWAWSIAGIALLTLGAVAALRGGILYDVHGSGAARSELSDVIGGNVHPGIAAGDTTSTPRSRRKSRELDHRRQALERAAIEAPRPSMVRPAAALLLLVAVFLLVSQRELYPTELRGQTNTGRSLGCVIVLALAGLRILTAQPGHRLRISSGLAALAGVLLILNGLLARHDRFATAVAEVICGALAFFAAAVVFTHEPQPPRRPGSCGSAAHAEKER